ncbi:zinc chelation protein SecC [Stenotrophomonas maltophilia]|nr:zinc chelation protein SecC [Stenotrophomonas maltophilia]
MNVVTTTPTEITRAIRYLADTVVPRAQPVYLPVQPEADAIVHECFPNVQAKVGRDGGQMRCGWQLWEWPNVLVEAEFHAVWVSPAGELIDITPKPEGEARILFVPDPSRRYEGVAIDNVRRSLRDDQLIRHFIQVSEAIVRVMNRGKRAFQYGEVSVPVGEIQPLLQARDFLGQSLGAGLREHTPCLCGSGSKYKRCHGVRVEAFFRR